MEKPEDKIMNEVETPERNRDWAEDITIPVPLNEYMKLKRKVMKLRQENKIKSDKYWKEWSRANEAEKKYDALKADYQKLLGMDEEGEKADE